MAYHCSCNARLKDADQRGLYLHLRSLAHRRSELVRGMLADSSLSLREVGRRLKLSGERVRQLALQFGIDRQRGPEQLKQQKKKEQLRKREEGLPRLATPTLEKKLARLRGNGYRVLVSLRRDRERSASDLEINGHCCTIRVTRQLARTVTAGQRVKYYSFKLKRRSAEFVLFHIEERNDTYVVPVSWLGPGETSWVPYGRIEGYHGYEQRDWEQWREAWSQLNA